MGLNCSCITRLFRSFDDKISFASTKDKLDNEESFLEKQCFWFNFQRAFSDGTIEIILIKSGNDKELRCVKMSNVSMYPLYISDILSIFRSNNAGIIRIEHETLNEKIQIIGRIKVPLNGSFVDINILINEIKSKREKLDVFRKRHIDHEIQTHENTVQIGNIVDPEFILT